jgi:murein DD-endopeptidase MepM/ murein hydrolase activator NlpD
MTDPLQSDLAVSSHKDQRNFHYMGNHRASRRGSPAATSGSSATTAVPAAGRRKAVKHAGSRGPLFKRLPSTPVLLGIAALSISATGAVSAGASDMVAEHQGVQLTSQASALSGTSTVASTSAMDKRQAAVSRDSRRDALEDATSDKLQAAAEAQAQARNAELAKLAKSAEKQAAKIALNLWHLPLTSYRLTARFGESSGLWANMHTGLDFAAPTGTPVMSVTNGIVTSVGSDGAYGNKVIVTTEDGEELWYCHLTAFAVSEGDTLRSGEVLGYVGSTGNTTGPHLHLEVRPGAGDPVDPYYALVAHGVTP